MEGAEEDEGAAGEEADDNDDDIIILVVVRSFVGELYVLSISLFLPLLSAFCFQCLKSRGLSFLPSFVALMSSHV